jgi:DNA modification methylase
MTKLALLVSLEAQSAFFADYLNAARQELKFCLNIEEAEHRKFGDMDFLIIDGERVDQQQLLRLATIQGIFAIKDEQLTPINETAGFDLPKDLVFGSKFRGKTNERLTQYLINLGLAVVAPDIGDEVTLLDPMCGRGTTLFWAMQYGIRSKGIEKDAAAIGDIIRNAKKWCKVHRLKNNIEKGSLAKDGKKPGAEYLDMTIEKRRSRVVNGDARTPNKYFGKEKFDLIVADLPYGVQHFGDVHGQGADIESVLQASSPAWREASKPNSALVLSYNKYNPKRPKLLDIFKSAGWEPVEFELPHRMSESIVRDSVVFK